MMMSLMASISLVILHVTGFYRFLVCLIRVCCVQCEALNEKH